jgi:hypothetical protein
VLYIIAFLLLILILSNEAARGLLKSVISWSIRFGVLLLMAGVAILVVYLCWLYITHYMPDISKLLSYSNFLKYAKYNWVIYPVAFSLITAFLILIHLIGIIINKWIEKADNIKFWKSW